MPIRFHHPFLRRRQYGNDKTGARPARNVLATSGVYAQTAPAGDAPVANPVDPASIQALKNMGAHLQTLKRFQVSTELSGERAVADGQKLQHSATADLDVDRPNKLRARMFSSRSQRELFYDGKAATLYTPAQNILHGRVHRQPHGADWQPGR